MMRHSRNFWDDDQWVEVVNLPIIDRCEMLEEGFTTLSLQELEIKFPFIVESIFNCNDGIGWGLRTISKESDAEEFDVLTNFFMPLGPFFQFLYRLLDGPAEFRLTMQNDQDISFYGNLIYRINSTLGLNSFKYFMLKFAIHGTEQLHVWNSDALDVHNYNEDTIYFQLATYYFRYFLPPNPYRELPLIIQQPLQSTDSFKHIILAGVSRHSAWRTEFILNIFISIWLTYNPPTNNEFFRLVKVLVEHIHAFGNSAEVYNASMVDLRKTAQPMLSYPIYAFLKSITVRFPNNFSLTAVLKVWLSYIQPWNYHYNHNTNLTMYMPINRQHIIFIEENIINYTEGFILFLNSFKWLNFTENNNVKKFYRLANIFSQKPLLRFFKTQEIIIEIEYFLRILCLAELSHIKDMEDIECEDNQINEIQESIDLLQKTIELLSSNFEIAVPDVPCLNCRFEDLNFCTGIGDNRTVDISHIGPLQMKESFLQLEYNIDPAVLPIRNNENKFLARKLFSLSFYLNGRFQEQINRLWYRQDILANPMKWILLPPITTHHFDKYRNIPELICTNLPPRICLRFLASYSNLVIILCAIIGSHLMLGNYFPVFLFLIIITLLFSTQF